MLFWSDSGTHSYLIPNLIGNALRFSLCVMFLSDILSGLEGSLLVLVSNSYYHEWMHIKFYLKLSAQYNETLISFFVSLLLWFFVVVQSLSRVWLFANPWTAACQASLSFTISQSLLKFMFIESVMPSSHLILCHSLSSCLWSFPASGCFPMCQRASGGQSIGASASASALVLPVNIQGWFPSGLTGLFSLQSKGLLRVFSNSTVWRHQFFGAHPFLLSNSHIHIWLLEKPQLQPYRPLLAKKCLCFLICCLCLSLLSSSEQASFNFIAAVTTHSDFGVQENKICHYFHCFPIYLPWSDRTRSHDLHFLNVEF